MRVAYWREDWDMVGGQRWPTPSNERYIVQLEILLPPQRSQIVLGLIVTSETPLHFARSFQLQCHKFVHGSSSTDNP